jgi:hypothetical protein
VSLSTVSVFGLGSLGKQFGVAFIALLAQEGSYRYWGRVSQNKRCRRLISYEGLWPETGANEGKGGLFAAIGETLDYEA